MQYTGKIIFIGDIETVGQNGLQKRTFVLEEESDREYKGSLSIDLMKDKVNSIDKYKIGDTITATLNSKANYSENTQRYYNSINAWKINGDSKQLRHETSVDDDLPF